MKKYYFDWGKHLSDIKKYQGGVGHRFVKEQLKEWLSIDSIISHKVNNYTIIDVPKMYEKPSDYIQEYLVVRNDCLVFKSFDNEQEAINYCLDKINTESQQLAFI